MVTVTSLKFQRYETKTDQKNIVPLTLELTWILNLAFLAVQKCFPVSSPRRMSFATKRGLDQAAQNLNYFNMWSKVVQYYKYVSRNNPRETRFGNGTQVKPCRSGLRTGWVTNRAYRLKGPYVVLSFLFLLFCVLCGVIVNSILKSRFSIISASGFRKRQKQENKYGPVPLMEKP